MRTPRQRALKLARKQRRATLVRTSCRYIKWGAIGLTALYLSKGCVCSASELENKVCDYRVEPKIQDYGHQIPAGLNYYRP